MTDIHAHIQRYLQGRSDISSGEPAGATITKAGVVPFVRGVPLRFYVMKPQAKIKSLAPPPFQICKGTRMFRSPEGWQDMRGGGSWEGERETLAQTALREGIEELGLKLENIKQMFDFGRYGFSSATTGEDRAMWLFAVELLTQDDFLPAAEIAQTTAQRAWMSCEEFCSEGRDDHRHILLDFNEKLLNLLG